MAETDFLVSSIEDMTSMLTEHLFKKSFRKDFKSLCDEIEKVEDFLSVEHCGAVGNVSKFFFRNGMSRKINKLNCRFVNFQLRWFCPPCEGPDMNPSAVTSRRNARAHIPKEQPIRVGMEIDIKKISDLLLQRQGHQVIAVVDWEGQDQTLLVRTVFNMQSVVEHFEHRFWVVVSQKLNVYDVPKLMGKALKPENLISKEEMALKREDLNSKEEIKEFLADLEGQRCLFVFDDVWDRDDLLQLLEQINVWPIQSNYKIVITSRNTNVAEGLRYVHTHQLNRLSEDDSRTLSSNYASVELPEEELKNLEKCCGLPLAIKAIGASMASGRWLPNDSKASLSCLNQLGAMSGSDSVIPALKLSYERLPNNLKPCFLYFSVFPKNMEIDCEYLLHMWIAQRFVFGASLGRFYIEELIGRCLIEVSQVGGDGRVKVCKIHNLLHDLAVRESHTECLLKSGECLLNAEEEVGRSGVQWRGLRTISLIKNNIPAIKEAFKCPELRILLLSQNFSLKSISASFFSNLTYLTVLDLSDTALSTLPKSIGKLKHLKFLNLSSTGLLDMPECLSGLVRLQYLNVSHCSNLENLHSGISRNKLMLYLNMEGCGKLKWLPKGISKLSHLQTLKGTLSGARNDAKALQLSDLKGLINLRHLALEIGRPSENIAQPKEGTFGEMKKMQSLSVINNGSSYLNLPSDMGDMDRLQVVCLRKCVIPSWIFELPSLTELDLQKDDSTDSDYKGLAFIPNLKKLHLSDNDTCIEFPEEFGECTAFPKLEELMVENFSRLEKFPSLQDTAMPMLKYFRLRWCHRLRNIAQGLERLKSLKEVEILRNKGDRELWEGEWLRTLIEKRIKPKVSRYDQATIDGIDNSTIIDGIDNSTTANDNALQWWYTCCTVY